MTIDIGTVKKIDDLWEAYFHGELVGRFFTERGAKRAVTNASKRFQKFCAEWAKIHDKLVDASPKIKNELYYLAKEGLNASTFDLDLVIVAIRRMIGLEEMTPSRKKGK